MAAEHVGTGPGAGGNDAAQRAGVLLSRRALLRSASIAVPTILTLHSGAALAQTSNLVGAAPTPTVQDNKYRCLDTSSVYRSNKPNVYDLGSPPLGHVTRITADGAYYRVGSNGQPSNNAVSGPTMCNEGGAFYRKANGWTQVSVEQGVLVSATALSSFSSVIRYTDV
jgi:hypothetical protein